MGKCKGNRCSNKLFFTKFSLGEIIPPDPLANMILWLDATLGKTGNPISAWADQSGQGNNATQGTGANQPTDNTTYVTFDGGDNMDCGNANSVNIKHTLTYYARFSTSATTNFMGLFDKYIGGGTPTGSALFLNASKVPAITAGFLKTSVTVTATTVVNDGNIHKVHGTIECTKKWRNKREICNGEEPSIIKEGSTYYMFYSKWDGTQSNIYRRSDTSPYFENSSETLVVSDKQYCQIWKDGSTYRLILTDDVVQNIQLYTSATIDGTYTLSGTLVTYGAAYDAYAIADPHEIKIGSTYYLYYSAFSAPETGTICYATSATGSAGSYTKQGTTLGNGGAGTFDQHLCADPDIKLLPDNSTYIMFYTGFNTTYDKQQQGYATSTDGITWTKFSGNPIHYFSGESFEVGVYGPNEPFFLLEDGIWRMWYRSRNDSAANYKIAYAEFTTNVDNTPYCGNETITTKIYVDNVLENTNTITGTLGLDYIVPAVQNLIIGGDNVSTSYLTGNVYEFKVWNDIKTSV